MPSRCHCSGLGKFQKEYLFRSGPGQGSATIIATVEHSICQPVKCHLADSQEITTRLSEPFIPSDQQSVDVPIRTTRIYLRAPEPKRPTQRKTAKLQIT